MGPVQADDALSRTSSGAAALLENLGRNNGLNKNTYSFGGTPKARQPLMSCLLLSVYKWNL
jgi:hypothetical protein